MNSPEPDGARAPTHEGTTVDAFFAGRFHLVQPARGGYRSGLDALLLAAAVPDTATGRLVDLGSGAGAVGFACAVRAPQLSVTLVEREPAMAAFAREGLARLENGPFADRVRVIQTDLLAPRGTREAAGLRDDDFDWVVSNPPFYGAAHRRSPDALRAGALSMETPGALVRWIAVAGALARPGGRFAMILPPDRMAQALEASANRFGALSLVPIHARGDRPAIRVVLTGVAGSKAPLRLLPACTLHDAAGEATPFSRAVSEGCCDLGGFA